MAAIFINDFGSTLAADFGTSDNTLTVEDAGFGDAIVAALYGANWNGAVLPAHFVPLVVTGANGIEVVKATNGAGNVVTILRVETPKAALTGATVECLSVAQFPESEELVGYSSGSVTMLVPGEHYHLYNFASYLSIPIPWLNTNKAGAFMNRDHLPMVLTVYANQNINTVEVYDLDFNEITAAVDWEGGAPPASIPAGSSCRFEFRMLQPAALRNTLGKAATCRWAVMS